MSALRGNAFAALALSLGVSLALCASSAAGIKHVVTISDAGDRQDLRGPLSFCVDRYRNEIYVADTGNAQVVVFNTEGMPLKKIRSGREQSAPFGIAVDSEGRIYVSHLDEGSIDILDFRGQKLGEIIQDSPGTEPRKPGRMTVDELGNLYAVDRANQEVLVFDSSGSCTLKIKPPSGTDVRLEDVAVDRYGTYICVISALGNAVYVFDRQGRFIRSIDKDDRAEGRLAFPTGGCFDGKGKLWIADSFHHMIRAYDLQKGLLSEEGGFGESEGEFFFPVDIDFDSDERLYVLERGAGRVQVFEREH